jgi:putative RNA 2'-phosphotransferase
MSGTSILYTAATLKDEIGKRPVMEKWRQIKTSKFLSYVLRHHPDSCDIKLDSGGWVDVEKLIQQVKKKGIQITLDDIRTVVRENDKQRFSFSEDELKIRANYGHSIAVDLGYSPVEPPDVLYHGTAEKNLKAIHTHGLTRGHRQYVHLSLDVDTALSIGQRYGKPVVLKVKSGKMYLDGYKFYFSKSGIWLTECVPFEYLSF